jgi:tetratricopeptide (TPR) repeat protein
MYRYWPSFSQGFATKGYSLSQQVATEARIVVHYLSQFVMPNLPEFGPFHDDFPLSDAWHDPRALAAATALFVLAGLAWWGRHRCPLFAAGVFVFLWGHALESSVIPLELYFEHRNYIPVLGLAMALTGLTLALRKYQQLALSGLLGLILLFTFSTYQYAAIWGQRHASAQYWYSERPQSVRAVLSFADQLGEQRRWSEADQLVSKAWSANPGNMGFAMPMLYVACRSAKLNARTFGELTYTMRTGQFTRTSALIVHRVLKLVTSGQCTAFTLADILTILDALADNPSYQVEAETVADFMIIRAKALFAQGHSVQSADLLSQAIGIDFRLSIALQAVKLFEDAGQHAQAVRILQRVRSQLPTNPWLRARWLKDVENTEATIAHFSKRKTTAID